MYLQAQAQHAGIETMINPMNKQKADFRAVDLNTIYAHLKAQGFPIPKERFYAQVVRYALTTWLAMLNTGDVPSVRKLRDVIDARYRTEEVTTREIGHVQDYWEATDAIYALIVTPSVKHSLTMNRWKSPRRSLIIYLAVYYVAARITAQSAE